MPVRQATPEETKALFGAGLIVFGPGLRPPPGWKRPASADAPQPVPSKVPGDQTEATKEV